MRGFLVLVWLLSSPMWAMNRYVSTSGVDTGSCTTASPLSARCRTVRYALSQSSCGDTIYVADGIYDGYIESTDTNDCEGSTSITITAENRHAAILRNTGSESHIMWWRGEGGVTIKDFQIEPSGGIAFGNYNSGQIRLEGNKFILPPGSGAIAIRIYNPSGMRNNIEIVDNEVTREDLSYGGTCWYIYNARYVLLNGNVCNGAHNPTYFFNVEYMYVNGDTYRDWDNHHGIDCYDCKYVLVENSLFYLSGDRGSSAAGGVGGYAMDHVVYRNNTFVGRRTNSKGYAAFSFQGTSACTAKREASDGLASDTCENPKHIVFLNNVVVGWGTSGYAIKVDDRPCFANNAPIFHHNFYHDYGHQGLAASGDSACGRDFATLSEWKTDSDKWYASSHHNGSGSIEGEPHFVDEARYDYRLTASSPMVNAGYTGTLQLCTGALAYPCLRDSDCPGSTVCNLNASACPSRDFDGNLRNEPCDIGAFEYSGTPPPSTPPSEPPPPVTGLQRTDDRSE